MNISLSPGDDESFGYGLQLGFSPCERGAPDNTKNGREMPVGQQQRQLATTTTISGSRRHGAVFSVVFASVVTLVLVYSLTRASWTDFGSAGGSQAWYDDECLNSLSEGRWELSTGGCPASSPGVLVHCDNSTGLPRRWASSAPAGCLPPSLVQADVAAQFWEKRVAFVGDSHLRKLYNFLGEFLADERITVAPSSDKKEHKDFSTTVEATRTRLEFYWRAEIRSTASVINEFLGVDGVPDLVVCDASAHQAKWARDYDAFMGELPDLVKAVKKYQDKFPASLVVWLISPPFREVYDASNPETEFFSTRSGNLTPVCGAPGCLCRTVPSCRSTCIGSRRAASTTVIGTTPTSSPASMCSFSR